MQPEFTKKLLEWNAAGNSRKMPWKGETDPYRIWLSEIILQQTRVEQGWKYYERFVETYPDVNALAKAPEADVFKLWEGLGYYSRCRNLIATARYIAETLNGQFPSNYHDILLLKGVGPYTAAAIASFAFNESRAVVDGNVQRVLARYFGISTPVDTTDGKKLFTQLAQSLLPEDVPGIYNQAIMDFGATICKPKNPLCDICVQSADCEAFRHGFVNKVPVKEKVITVRSRWMYYFIIRNGESVYIRKREDADIWQNLYEFVLLETPEELNMPASDFLDEVLRHPEYKIQYSSGVLRQQLTHQNIRGKFYVVDIYKPVEFSAGYMLVRKSNLHEYAFPRFINSFLESHPI